MRTGQGTIARNNAWAQQALRRLGFSLTLRTTIAGEVGSHFLRMRDFHGGTEDQDLWAVAIATAWWTRETMPAAGGGLIRLRVRWALRELVRQEARAHGLVRSHRRTTQTSADPAQWRRCPCGQPVAGRQADYCARCRRERERARWKAAWARKKGRRLAVAA